MDFWSFLRKQGGEKYVRFKGYGYSQEQAYSMAMQRMKAWEKEQKKAGKRIVILTSDASYGFRNSFTPSCTIRCSYRDS